MERTPSLPDSLPVTGSSAARKRFHSTTESVTSRQPPALRLAKSLPTNVALFYTDRVLSHLGQVVTDRLDEDYVTATDLSFQRDLGFLMPYSVTEETGKIYSKLLSSPLTVSDQELSEIFDLQEWVEHSDQEKVDDGEELYYMRTFTLKVSDLVLLLLDWELQDIEPSKYVDWFNALELSKTDVVHIRYIGQVTGPRNPLDRHEEDLDRNSGVLREFFESLERVTGKKPSEIGTVHEFVNARLSSSTDVTIKDLRERILIAVFQRRYLLNAQPGGFLPTYTPPFDDRNFFCSLRIQFFTRFKALSAPASDDLVGELESWKDVVSQLSADNPAKTLSQRHPLSDKYLNSLLQAGIPSSVCGHTLLCLVGKDVTIEALKDGVSFFDANGRSSTLAREFLARLEGEEYGYHRFNPRSVDTSAFPFVDLYPWFGLDSSDLALEQLLKYLNITKPLITITMGSTVSSYALSNFTHDCGFRGNFLDVVGIPQKRYYAHSQWLHDPNCEGPPEDTCTAVLPITHFGLDKHGSQCMELRAVMDANLWVGL